MQIDDKSHNSGEYAQIPDLGKLSAAHADILATVPGLRERIDKIAHMHTLTNEKHEWCDCFRPPGAAKWPHLMDPYAHAATVISDLGRYGQKYGDLIRSHVAVGPVYNDHNEFGVPIPQKYMPLSLLPPGLHNLTAVERKFWSKELEFRGEPSGEKLPYIFPFDIDVALYLTFSGSFILEPGLSLENIRNDERCKLQWKQFDPGWLGYTALGQSFFYADYLLKQLCMGNAFNSLTDPAIARPQLTNSTDGADFSIPLWMESLYHHREHLEQKDPYMDPTQGRLTGRFCLTPTSLNIARNGRTISLLQNGVFIESSYIHHKPDGTQDRTLYSDDPNYATGKQAEIFNYYYADYAQAFPVFERVRQLYRLLGALKFMREDGYEPRGATKERMDAFGAWIINQQPMTEFVVRPYHKSGCDCTGGCNCVNLEVVVGGMSSDDKRIVRHRESIERPIQDRHDFWGTNYGRSGTHGMADAIQNASDLGKLLRSYQEFMPACDLTLRSPFIDNCGVTREEMRKCVPTTWVGPQHEGDETSYLTLAVALMARTIAQRMSKKK